MDDIDDNMDPKTANARVMLLLLQRVKPITDEIPLLGAPDLTTLRL